MEKKYKITYLPLFYDDLDKITDYIRYQLKNEIAANKFVDELEKLIQQRASNLSSYEKYNSSTSRKYAYYRIYVKNYTIFYVLKDDTMELRRILYSKRDFDKLI